MNENPHCFKRRHGRCVPLFERDWLYDWLLRDVPVRRANMLKVIEKKGGNFYKD